MDTPTTEMTGEGRQRARTRRLARMKARGVSAARRACLTCPVMALLWVLGLWYEIPLWAVAMIVLGVIPAVLLLSRVVMRGRTVRASDDLAVPSAK